MDTTVIFKTMAVQEKAFGFLKSGTKHIPLFGGSRSGKTTILVMAIIYRVLRYTGSRYFICRYLVKDAHSFVLRETPLPWLNNAISFGYYTCPAHENTVTLYNGSEIRIGGLEDREQAGKIMDAMRYAVSSDTRQGIIAV